VQRREQERLIAEEKRKAEEERLAKLAEKAAAREAKFRKNQPAQETKPGLYVAINPSMLCACELVLSGVVYTAQTRVLSTAAVAK